MELFRDMERKKASERGSTLSVAMWEAKKETERTNTNTRKVADLLKQKEEDKLDRQRDARERRRRGQERESDARRCDQLGRTECSTPCEWVRRPFYTGCRPQCAGLRPDECRRRLGCAVGLFNDCRQADKWKPHKWKLRPVPPVHPVPLV